MVMSTAAELIGEAERDERERCAKIAVDVARQISKGTLPRAGSVEEIGQRIADAIRNED